MKILVNGLSVTSGGGLAVATNLLGALSRAGSHQFDVLVKSDTLERSRAWEPGIRFLRQSAAARNAASRVVWEQIRIPRMMKDYDALLGLAGVGVATRRIPQVVVAQNAYFFYPLDGYPHAVRVRSLVQRTLFRMTMRRGAACVAVSETLASQIRRLIGDGADVSVIANAPDLPPALGTRQAGGRSDRAIVLWIGSRSLHKNLGEFLEAVPRVGQVLSPATSVEFLVMGDIAARQVRPSEDVATAVSRSSQRVRLIGNITEQERVRVMKSSDVIVLTSKLEAGPLVPLEASALRVPIVAADIPAHREFLDDSCLYPLGDVDSLASSIASVLNDPQSSAESVRANANRVAGASWTAAARSYMSVIYRIAEPDNLRKGSVQR